MPEDVGRLSGNPLVVHYAPQIDLLRRASVTVTHAGINTTLESLSAGVPLVAIPLGDDQPGVASRIEWTGTGTMIRLMTLSPARLRDAIEQALHGPSHHRAAQAMRTTIQNSRGVQRAADIVERVLGTAVVFDDRPCTCRC